MSAIFISHSSADDAAAAQIKAWLEAQGHTSLFLDFDPEAGIKGGSGWEQTLYRKLRQCQAVIALLTPNWLASKWCFAELVQARERGKAIFPLKVQPCDPASVFGDIQHIDLTVRPDEGLERLRLGLLERGLDPLDVFDWDPGRPPYPGLLAFEEQDAAIFFGRGADILKALETLDALRRQGSEVARLVLLLGASGSGKSSLLRAGIIPRLRKKPGEWLPAPPFRPQVEPVDELAMALAAAFARQGEPRDWRSIRSALHEAAATTPADGHALLRFVNDLAIAAKQPEATVLLTIDQTEELFGYTPAEAASRFLRLLRAALEFGGRRLMAVATLRSDFLGEFQNHPALQDSEYAQHLRYRALPIDPMPLRSFPEIIRGPARLAGLELEDGLVEAMVGDTGTRDALPLLAFTLRRLYERFGGDGRLTLAEYESIGRLDGAVREEAERIIDEAKPSADDLDALHAAFVPTMVRITAEGAYARRRALIDDLPRRVLALLRRFIDARLLVTDRDPRGRETSEVAHEALLRTWPQLSDWLLEDRDKLRLLEGLQRAAEEWEQGGRSDELLVHRDGRLKDVAALAGNPRFGLPDASAEHAYLDACIAAQQAREEAARAEQERRILDAERIAEEQTRAAAAQKRAATIFRRFSFVAFGLFVIAALAAGQAYLASEEATRQYEAATAANKRVIEVQQLARHTRDIGLPPQRSLLLSVRAASLASADHAGTLTAIDGLRQQLRTIGGQPLQGHEKATRVAAFSADRRWLATASEDGAIRLWPLDAADPASRSFALAGHQGAVHGLAFSADGRWLLSGGADGMLRTWRLTAEGAEAGPVYGQGRYGVIQALAINGQGDWLAFGTQSGKVCIWRMGAEGPIEANCEAWADEVPVMKVQFSPGGRWLATTCSGACKDFGAPVRLWDLTTNFPDQAPRLLKHATRLVEDSLLAIAFSADDSRLAAAYGYVAEVWDLTQEDPPAHKLGPFASGGGWISALAVSPDRRWLAIGGGDVRVMLWDLTGARTAPTALKGHSAGVNDLAFSVDGRWLASGSEDATTRLWDMADPTNPVALLRGQDLAVRKVLFGPGPGPRHLLTLGDEPNARLFGIPDSLVDPAVLRGTVGLDIIGMAVSADGRWIATSSVGDNRLMLWSASDARRPRHELPLPTPSHAITFSADGRWLAAKSQDQGVISLWRLADPAQPPLVLTENEWGDVRTLRFSPDNRWLVSGTWGGKVNLWDVAGDTPALEQRHRCNQGEPVREPAFSADGRHLATAAHGHAARLWDLTATDPCAAPRTLPHGNVVYQAVISPDGRWAATAGFDMMGKLWDLGAGAEPKLVSATAFKDRVLQAAFDRDSRWVAFGSWDRTLKLVDLKKPAASAPIELSGHAGRISAIAFSPDGNWLVSASEDGTVRQWDPAAPAAAPVVLRGHEARVMHAAISPDSRWVVSAANDGTVRRWRLQLSDLIDLACRTAGRSLTADEARTFLGDEQAAQPCADQAPREASSGG